ncbi:hypothetical protein LTR08_000245 [Meristemomyces frigidus]|nr:hypothetical protein LTR08_000245 [Meristemomyces frigidus]
MNIHPFFRPTTGLYEQQDSEALTTSKTVEGVNEGAEPETPHDQTPKARKKRKSNGPVNGGVKGKRQKTLQDIVKPKSSSAAQPSNGTEHDVVNLCSSDPAVGVSRRKRRRTDEHQAIEGGAPDHTSAPLRERIISPSSPRVVIPAPLPFSNRLAVEQTDHTNTKAPRISPKKILKLNASGRFSSPISRTEYVDDERVSAEAPKRRGRPRKAKEVKSPKQLLVKLTYGADDATKEAVGQRVDRILAGEDSVPVATPQLQTTPKKPRIPKRPAKSTHPFFLSKPNEPPPVPKQDSPRKSTATTPGKLRNQVFGDRKPEVVEALYPVGSALLKDRLMVKHPGAKEPPWPDREQTHVRALDDNATLHIFAKHNDFCQKQRKRKAAQLPFPAEQSILSQFALNLVPEKELPMRADGFHNPHPSLRLPVKRLISGHDIRRRIGSELSVFVHDDAEGELSLPTPSQLSTHPALQKLWDHIPNTLTAFDEGRGENMSWTLKYAPASATEVLQPAREMTILKDWLTSLTVTSVESTTAPQTKHAAKPEPKPRRKRRRKPEDLDDFLVDSDEDVHSMDELTDPEDAITVLGSTLQKSVIQVAVEGTKLSNAVLLSGRHGCGKTAAAYAVAKELGFKVFDISPHERRSGKDVLDKVGDMAENHLVKHHGVDAGELSSTEEPNKVRLEEAFQRDLASGRQGKMNAFFSAKVQTKKAVPKQKAPAQAISLETLQTAIKKPPKDQQQSLILLEEVDILFKDDKEFWNTVLKLIATSKRPFIMTCNDENLVPLQAMSLHAILRFSPPTADLATDYMLLIAAAEGHLLRRDAVSSLYESKRHDLRASITELHMWCQMGVGDPRGGLSWIYQRWPPGSDIDQYGRKLRVVSDGTYQQGMGLLPDPRMDEPEQMPWVWNELGIEPSSLLHSSNATATLGTGFTGSSSSPEERISALNNYAALVETLSSLDTYTALGLPGTAPLDTTQPLLSEKARHQYVEGLPLLQADEEIDHGSLSMSLVVATFCAVSRVALLDAGASNRGEQSLLSREQLHASVLYERSSTDTPKLTRRNFACFDAISILSDNALSVGSGLTLSAFDGPLNPIAIDMAPYVRSIVQYDLAREEQRERLNTVLAESDGRKAKRARTTRAARSALEGSQRASTRRERWFAKGLDLQAVLATGGSDWPKATLSGLEATLVDGFEAPASSSEAA